MRSKDKLAAVGFSPWEISALVNQTVLEQHADNAAFLWFMRDNACRAPNFLLKDLARLDERLEANLAGLRAAREDGWKLASLALKHDEPGTVFAAAILAFSSGDSARIDAVMEAGCANRELERALISSLGWQPFELVEVPIRRLLQSLVAGHRLVGIGAFSVNRRDPGLALREAFTDSDQRVRARAFRAAGELGKTDLQPFLDEALTDSDTACRFWSTWSSARLGVRTSQICETLREIVESRSPCSEPALPMALLCLDLPAAEAWIGRLLDRAHHLRLGARGAGLLGDPQWIDQLIRLMENPQLSRVAGEAFSRITGVDLAYANLSDDKPDDVEVTPNEDPNDENVAMDVDEGLPWPDQTRVARWWRDHRADFRNGLRYIAGRLITLQSLTEYLVRGTQRGRATAALELALRQPQSPLFEVRARGSVQFELLNLWTS